MIVSPDVGGVVRARNIATRIHSDLAIIDKRRPRAGVSEVMNVIGDVKGRDCIIVDDIVDSGGTLINAAKALLETGASSASVYVTHGVLSGEAATRIGSSALEMLTITNTIAPTQLVNETTNIRLINMAPLIADAMDRISNEKSVSSLFD
jgi:ribose-phosphate pyrophosphokinase